MTTEDAKKTELNLGSGANLEVVSTKLITTVDQLILFGPEGDTHQLNIRIEADLSNIPEEYHHAFLNMFSAKYLGRVTYVENVLSEHDKPKRKWYEFWKIIRI
jgi:hypothetical protein